MIVVTCLRCGRKLYEYEAAYGDGELFGLCEQPCPGIPSTPSEAAPSSGHAGAPVVPAASSLEGRESPDCLDERGSWPAVRTHRRLVTLLVVLGSILIPALWAALYCWTRGVRPW
jgi:hypothetical protein